MRGRQRRLIGDINVVPYIDVMLVLLVIFMITAPLLTQGIDVDLPRAAAQPLETSQANEPLVLSIDRDGRLYLNVGGENVDEPIDEDAVRTRTAAVLRRNAGTPAYVKSDQSVSVGRLVSAMILLQQAGAENVGIITDTPQSPQDENPQE